MTIGFDGSRAFVKNKTGTENYSYQLLKHFAKIDNRNNYIIYLRPGNELDPQDKWPANFKFELLNFSRFWTQIGLAIETFQDNLDILFTSAHTLPLVKKPGLKTLMTIHDLGAEYLPGMHQLKQRLYLDFITKFQLKNTTRLIAVSKATQKDLIKKARVNPKKIRVIYEGVNFNDKKLLKTDQLRYLLDSFNIKRDKYMLFVGTIQPRKNLHRLIEAFNNFVLINRKDVTLNSDKSEDIKLVIAGSKGWLADDIYKLPKKLGIEDKVKFLGRVSQDQLGALYMGALAFVYPSLYEGFGLPILEAMSFGCPVLTSNLSSMPEVAGDSAILIEPYDIDSISNGMIALMDENIRKSLITKGYHQVKKFTWEKTARQTLDLIEQIVKKH